MIKREGRADVLIFKEILICDKEPGIKEKLTILCGNSVGIPFDVLEGHGFACFLEKDTGRVKKQHQTTAAIGHSNASQTLC